MILGVPARPGLRIMVASKPVNFREGMDWGQIGARVAPLPAE